MRRGAWGVRGREGRGARTRRDAILNAALITVIELALVGLLLAPAAWAAGPAASPTSMSSAPADPDMAPIIAMERFQQRLFVKAAPSVVFIKTPRVFGSGFFVTRQGHILTNRHVVRGAQVVQVKRYGQDKFVEGVVVELADERLDLAVVKIEAEDTPALALAPLVDLRVGSWVASIGHGEGGAWTFTKGMISNIYPLGEDKPIIQTQIPLNRGNSGGPILDRQGRAIAIVAAGIMDANSVNFSIRADMAFKHLHALAGRCDCLVVRTLKDVHVFVDGKLAGRGPRVLLPLEPGHHTVAMARGAVSDKVELDYPATHEVVLGKHRSDSVASMEDERARALTVKVLDLDDAKAASRAPFVLEHWVGQRVEITLRDGSKPLVGFIRGVRDTAILFRTKDGHQRGVSIHDIRRIRRLD